MSISFAFGSGYRAGGLWTQAEQRNCGHVIGPLRTAHRASHGEPIVEAGAWFRPIQATRFFGVPAHELTDRILSLADLWGGAAVSLEAQFSEARCDDQRVDRLERALLQRLHVALDCRSAVDLPALAAFVQHKRGIVTVAELAYYSGVSRQHLGRIFHEEVGLPPKLFCRLARFRAALACAAKVGKGNGAELAAKFGYVDQSHMIAESREFSGLTPGSLLLQQRVHPFTGVSPIDRTESEPRP